MVNVAAGAVDAFARAARANSCTVHGPVRQEAAPGVVAQVVADASPGAVAIAPRDPALRALPFLDALLDRGRAVWRPEDPGWDTALHDAGVGITGARLAVAEQGVMALECGPEAPRATSLLPTAHVCVVFTDTIVATFAEAITALAREPLPSALTWIGGPSRTGDLEMVTTLGVHGPKAVDVVLVAVG
jgi:L-lactate dehydrogenase complex protein LldG